MDFGNFDRNVIEAIAERMAIAKMDSICKEPNGSFQQGFTLGFIEAFEVMRTVDRRETLRQAEPMRRTVDKSADCGKITSIADAFDSNDLMSYQTPFKVHEKEPLL